MTTTVHGYYHGHFNRKNIKAPKSVLECVEKLVSLAVRPKILLHWKNLCITSLQRVRLQVVPIFPQG